MSLMCESLFFVQVIYDKVTGRSRGFGFVTMSSVEDVEAAAQKLNGYVSFMVLCFHFNTFLIIG